MASEREPSAGLPKPQFSDMLMGFYDSHPTFQPTEPQSDVATSQEYQHQAMRTLTTAISQIHKLKPEQSFSPDSDTKARYML